MPIRRLFPLFAAVILGIPASAQAAPEAVVVQRPASSAQTPTAVAEPTDDAAAEATEPATEAVPTPPTLPPAPGDPAPAVESAGVDHTDASAAPAIDEAPAMADQPDVDTPPAPATWEQPQPAAQPPPSGLDFEPAGGADAWKRDYVKVERPRFRGTGMLVTSASLYATALAFQLGDATLCGNCARGLLERAFLGSAFALAPFGAAKRGRSDAYFDAAADRPRRNVRAMLIGGAALTAVGFGAGLANEVMWWQCMAGGEGPYVTQTGDNFFGPTCRYGVGRATLDLSAAAATAGVSMLAWSLRYRRDSEVYERARLSVAPTLSSTQTGLTLAGQF